LEDILKSARKIETRVQGLSFEQFQADETLSESVLYNLFIIGEAVKNLSPELREQHSQVEWRKIAGLRDIIGHAYFDVDLAII
jgi:uncharacterized protein with HEPN domain